MFRLLSPNAFWAGVAGGVHLQSMCLRASQPVHCCACWREANPTFASIHLKQFLTKPFLSVRWESPPDKSISTFSRLIRSYPHGGKAIRIYSCSNATVSRCRISSDRRIIAPTTSPMMHAPTDQTAMIFAVKIPTSNSCWTLTRTKNDGGGPCLPPPGVSLIVELTRLYPKLP